MKSLELPYKNHVIAVYIFDGVDGHFTVMAEVRSSGNPEPLTTLVSAERFVSKDAAHRAGIVRGQKWVVEQARGKVQHGMKTPTGGFTLIEILIAITVMAALTAIALQQFGGYQTESKISQAVTDLRSLDTRIQSYKLNNERLPALLTDLPQVMIMSDPWGRPYQYLNIEDADTEGKGQVRKDKNLVPINSDFDLYSMGADGETVAPLTAKASHDDIVRANDGGYFGLASKY
jgi:general secretion pathway protein G